MILQRALQAIYPHSCIGCGEPVEGPQALCAQCWAETGFITGLVCDHCGTPLPGDAETVAVYCDDCTTIARPWDQGRAAVRYSGAGRRLVLALKHGDRQDLAKPAARWMAKAAAPLLQPDMIVVPVPVHWRRLVSRRFNQAALLAREVAHLINAPTAPRALVRPKPTAIHDGLGREARFANMDGAIAPHPHHGRALAGRSVLLVDDVMTSGATLAAATAACHGAGAGRVCILVLARVAKDA